MTELGLQVSALFRNYLNQAGIPWKQCEEWGEKFQAKIEEVTWLSTDTGKTFVFSPTAPETILAEYKDDCEVIKDRAACASWPEPTTPGDFLMWFEDEASVQRSTLSAYNPVTSWEQWSSQIEYITHLDTLCAKLRAVGVEPTPAPWTVEGAIHWLARISPGTYVQLRNWDCFDGTTIPIEGLVRLFEVYPYPKEAWIGRIEFLYDYDEQVPAIIVLDKDIIHWTNTHAKRAA